ncbi:hypothetical protein HK097_002887, partial [Rhizophlyctis rosea]
NHHAFSRHIEAELFPTLGKFKIAFYAYSPIAGGILARPVEHLRNGPKDPNPFKERHRELYRKLKVLEGLGEWGRIVEEFGLVRGDGVTGVIVLAPLMQTVGGVRKGPLPQQVDRCAQG